MQTHEILKRIRILLFSSVTFKTSKLIFFLLSLGSGSATLRGDGNNYESAPDPSYFIKDLKKFYRKKSWLHQSTSESRYVFKSKKVIFNVPYLIYRMYLYIQYVIKKKSKGCKNGVRAGAGAIKNWIYGSATLVFPLS